MRVCYIEQLKKGRERKGGREKETDSWRSKKLQHHQIWCNTSVPEGTQPGLGIWFYLNSNQMYFHLNVPWETPSISAFVSSLQTDNWLSDQFSLPHPYSVSPNVTHGRCFIASLCFVCFLFHWQSIFKILQFRSWSRNLKRVGSSWIGKPKGYPPSIFCLG